MLEGLEEYRCYSVQKSIWEDGHWQINDSTLFMDKEDADRYASTIQTDDEDIQILVLDKIIYCIPE